VNVSAYCKRLQKYGKKRVISQYMNSIFLLLELYQGYPDTFLIECV